MKLLAKTISYRILATLITLLVSYFMTGSLVLAVNIASMEFLLKTIGYYIHEKIWDR